MRRTVIWSGALVVVLVMVGVAWYAAAANRGPRGGLSSRTALVATGKSSSPGGPTPYQAPPAITPPPGGISRDQAIAIAGRQLNLGPDALESAVVGRFADYAGGNSVPGSSPDELIWVVTFGGVFLTPCMAPPAVCEPMHHAGVLLDFYTGTVLLDFDRP